MTPFRVLPIPAEIVTEARSSGRSPKYGHPVHTEIATGYGPCRSCLRTFEVGKESRLLFTFDPFDGLDDYPSPGPVFVHHDGCAPFDADGQFPSGLRDLPLTLEGYGRGRWVIARERPAAHGIEDAIERLFAHSDVEYIHVRNTEAGCYIARVVRS
jgi:hypothetical protein